METAAKPDKVQATGNMASKVHAVMTGALQGGLPGAAQLPDL